MPFFNLIESECVQRDYKLLLAFGRAKAITYSCCSSKGSFAMDWFSFLGT